jgi:hypothetical protein
MILTKKAYERFRVKYIKDHETKCWNWISAFDKDGYGLFWVDSKQRAVRAHRISFMRYKKLTSLQPDQYICHHCDNPRCINPKHLYLGDVLTNNQDCTKRGRHINNFPVRCGELNGRARLTQLQVEDIRITFLTEKISKAKLARQYNVGESTIRHIIQGTSWNSNSNSN